MEERVKNALLQIIEVFVNKKITKNTTDKEIADIYVECSSVWTEDVKNTLSEVDILDSKELILESNTLSSSYTDKVEFLTGFITFFHLLKNLTKGNLTVDALINREFVQPEKSVYELLVPYDAYKFKTNYVSEGFFGGIWDKD